MINDVDIIFRNLIIGAAFLDSMKSSIIF